MICRKCEEDKPKTDLQPLWAEENIKKSNKLVGGNKNV